MENKRVLIIEDDPDFAASLRLALSLKQIDAEIAGTGGEGVAKHARGDYSVTVTDIKLPDFNGIEVIRRLRQRDAATRVLVMTGFRDPELIEQARLAGAEEVLLKPFRMKDFLDKVSRPVT